MQPDSQGGASEACFPSPPVIRGRGAGGEGEIPRGDYFSEGGPTAPLTPSLSPGYGGEGAVTATIPINGETPPENLIAPRFLLVALLSSG
jgi:hypothetical protein